MKTLITLFIAVILTACTTHPYEKTNTNNQISCEIAKPGAIPGSDCQPSGGGARGR